ncbi:hypothetical protein [Adonisia turfae]|uniref:Uncharacterized protein n=1 Tax=Adonisia turfae CCMR0081 TaxID=2292702 RepID=A0A6M0RR95_9CYAN|nr:hypothetical protein [Adonisia turfae]NEZ58777.1 hypothetical protein [Adonisia turfae CCMR0081]
MADIVPPKKTEKLIPVTVNLPREIIEKADALANDQGLSKGDLYRDCFLDGLAVQFEKYTKPEVYKKVRDRNQSTDDSEKG